MSATERWLRVAAERLRNMEGDTESNHIDADQILCDALLQAATDSGSEDAARDLLSAYNASPKWYA